MFSNRKECQMKQIGKNILCWCENPEEGAVQQAFNISRHPFLVGNVCLMPDTHQGYGMPIGGVAALKDAISPNMVGVDIGCGMLAVKTSLTAIDTADLKKIMALIRARVPVGFLHHEEPQQHDVFADELWENTFICKHEYESAQCQLGTLGGGNHFIEIQKGDDGYIWFMIHSGSRNLGKRVAEYYDNQAAEQCKIWQYDDIVKNELSVLPKGTKLFDDYLNEMTLCLKFSNANRSLMAKRIKESFLEIIPTTRFEEEINIQHNYAQLENHHGRNVYVHRKGATLARKNTIGIIPGSQGTCSYIVKGKGNETSMCSCSHGAGRKMSRNQARKVLDLAEEQRLLDEKGILHSIEKIEDLDEAASAYKDIDVVMQEQADLVDILVRLQPIAVVKG